jgi:hypothetical protein
MTTSDDTPTARVRATWWPVLSALFIGSVGYYAFTTGIAALPPFIALLLLGASATVLYRLLELVRGVFDNILIKAMGSVALMLAMLAAVIGVAWVLWTVLGTNPNPIERWQIAANAMEAVGPAALLLMCIILGLLGLSQVATLWRFVRANAFGPKRR